MAVPVYGVAPYAGSIELLRTRGVGIQQCDIGLIDFEMLVAVGIVVVPPTARVMAVGLET